MCTCVCVCVCSEYYHYRQKWIPLRWLPAESVFDDEFSTKSDVWAFGVLMWEVFSHGELPYTSLSHEEVLEGENTHIRLCHCTCDCVSVLSVFYIQLHCMKGVLGQQGCFLASSSLAQKKPLPSTRANVFYATSHLPYGHFKNKMYVLTL